MKGLTVTLLPLLTFSIITLFLSCTLPGQPPPNSVTWLARRYGVSEEKVRDVAEALGVRAEDMANFGEGEFPANYIREKLKEIKARSGQVTKEDVDQLLQGYEAKCELSGGQVVYYLFYSTNIRPGIILTREEALVFVFVYQQFEDVNKRLILMDWDAPNIADSGFEWRRQEILTQCELP